MTVFDEISVLFDNPSTDPMGYGAVEGKLFCGRDVLQLQFKEKDRAFRRNPSLVAEFEYGEVEKVELVSRWFRPRIFILRVKSAGKLADFPGGGVGRVELHLLKSSHAEAEKAKSLIEFRQTEANLEASESRLRRREADSP